LKVLREYRRFDRAMAFHVDYMDALQVHLDLDGWRGTDYDWPRKLQPRAGT
jgi:hypothetical protein